MVGIKAGLAALVAALLVWTPALADQTGSGSPYQGTHMWGGGWHGWILGPFMMIIPLGITVIIVVLIVRWLGGPGHGTGHAAHGASGKSALDILRERFAHGEIDKEEFEERRRVLEK